MSGVPGAVRAELAPHGDPARAAGQQAYMKSALPFYGVPVPVVRRLVAGVLTGRPPLDAEQWLDAVRDLWDNAAHREDRYAALAVARHRRYRADAADPARLPFYEHLVRTGAWWDLVDETAHLVGGVLAEHRAEAAPVIRGWARDDDRWVRRVAILSQLDHRDGTDPALLLGCLGPNLADPDFFIRKAIGWALRQYARHDPAWVRAVVADLGDRLSPLSRREALKQLG